MGTFFLLHLIFGTNEGLPRVETDNGTVEGLTTLHLNKEIDKFLGIPFAKPPINELRFQRPIPPDNWTGVFEAKKLPNSCVQGIDKNFGRFQGVEMWNANTNRSEDCLYLNIWRPKGTKESLPVMVWIYGGGFYSGTSTLEVYDGTTLAATENIVVVTFNYRIGMLGFIALGHPQADGNGGLFDQLLAMKWVKNNIANFGGDPTRITIYGESAGAASVSIHLVSKLSRPYYSRAILGSGASTSSWAVVPYDEIKRRSLLVAIKYLNCPAKIDQIELILNCLIRIKDPMLIAKYEFYVVDGISQFPFVPVIDGHFLTKHPSKSFALGDFKDCPLLMGTVKNEGNYFIVYESLKTYNILNGSDLDAANFSWTMSNLFYYYPIYPFVSSILITDLIKFFYSPWNNPQPSNIDYRSAIDAAVGDCYFICGLNIISEAYSDRGLPVYYYRFWHRSSASTWPEWMGVIHGDELIYTFGVPLTQIDKYLLEEVELSKRMLRYWGNFLRSGLIIFFGFFRDPNKPNNIVSNQLLSYWPPQTSLDKKYIFLKTTTDSTVQMIGTNPRSYQCAFWNSFMPKFASSI
ncbi:acetylcholinesterase-like [Octopus sinensis]|uniref:Carboxylic ester hydrolase n=1 Tax=Octopus sinensis TaxID=2607531 RepID=A0A6P7U0Z9_9MOLL|nr:acetylcholinesterase-like [Octopus sinensis]